MSITITEALAEIKTIQKRIVKKYELVSVYLVRQEGIRDSFEKDGGSVQVLAFERQSIRDLQDRIVALRRGIQVANEQTSVTINGAARSIADWLVWRREVAPEQQKMLGGLRGAINKTREKARSEGTSFVGPDGQATNPRDYVIHIDERELAKEIETLEDTLGQLDGQLSLKNATVGIAA